jgi:hypothetical protein
MPTKNLSPWPKFTLLNNAGAIAAGGKIFTYAAGTTTKLATFTDSTGATQNANPIVADANGRFDMWLTPGSSYKITAAPSTDSDPPVNAFWTVDVVNASPTSTQDQNFTAEWCGTATGTANSITLTLVGVPVPTAYAAGQRFKFIAASSNTGAVQANVAAIGLTNVLKRTSGGLVALVANDIIIGVEYVIEHDGTQFELQSPRTYAQGASVASAATVNLDTATGDYVHVTGTVTITAITLAQGEERTVVFDGALTLTNGASLVLLTAANRTTAAGDVSKFRGEAAGVVREVAGFRAAGGAFSKLSTVQVFNSGTAATYTTPAGATRIDVRIGGAGSSGSVGGNLAVAGNAGGATTFGTLTANGGPAATTTGTQQPAAATATGGDVNISGNTGGQALNVGAAAPGPNGAPGPFGGGAPAGGVGASAGLAGSPNSGAGGGAGSSNNAANAAGQGGNSGAYCEKMITSPAATYTYTVGVGGLSVPGNANGSASGAGADGKIIVKEFYD